MSLATDMAKDYREINWQSDDVKPASCFDMASGVRPIILLRSSKKKRDRSARK
jgi:hypothetical protein